MPSRFVVGLSKRIYGMSSSLARLALVWVMCSANGWVASINRSKSSLMRISLISSFSKLSNGLNYAYYKKLAESVDGVYSANVSEIQQGSRTMNVYVAGKGAAADNSTIAEVQSLMNENRIPGVYIMVVSAILTSKNVSVALTIKNGYSVPKTLSAVTAAIREHFEGMRVGQSFIAAELGAKIIAVPGVENYTFTNTADAVANSSTLFTAGTLSVERSVSS